LYFNRCFNFPSLSIDFPALPTDAQYGYYFTIWLKVEKNNYFCTEPAAAKNYYLFAYPHSLYIDSGATVMNYQSLMDNTATTTLPGFNYYEWNHVIIYVNSIPDNELKKSISLYTNFDIINPAKIFKMNSQLDLKLQGFNFCNGTCTVSGVSYTGINWGSAFYKKMRIWSIFTNLSIIRDYETKLYLNIII